jgi:heterodisulfide reductase subunit C
MTPEAHPGPDPAPDERAMGLLAQLAALPEGEHLLSCLQCGTCGGTCPVSRTLPHTPRRLFALARAGMDREVLESLTPHVCASCYACTVKCPAEIKITDLMYAIKRIALRAGIAPPDSDAARFAGAFTDVISRNGRSHELQTLMRYMIPRHPVRMLRQTGLGLGMMARGRMPILPERIEELEPFRRMVARALELEDDLEPAPASAKEERP